MKERSHCEGGFSTLELVVVVSLSIVVAGIAIPSAQNLVSNYRLIGDTSAITSQLSLAKMRAASSYAQGQLKFDASAGTFQIALCTSGCSTSSNWTNDGPQLTLSSGISFGYDSISVAAQPQSTISQTTPIIFNSRGYPVDSSGAATSNNAIYLTDGRGNYRAITVYADGRIATWNYQASAWTAIK